MIIIIIRIHFIRGGPFHTIEDTIQMIFKEKASDLSVTLLDIIKKPDIRIEKRSEFAFALYDRGSQS